MNRMQKKDSQKLTGKQIIKSMNEFKQIYMSDYLRNTSQIGNDDNMITNEQLNPHLGTKELNFLQVFFF
jgi:hypothetical protein